MDGTALVKWLAFKYPETRIVVMSPCCNTNIIRMTLEAGDRDYISRDTCGRMLSRAIATVLDDEVYMEWA
nr:hypothetical protein [Pantoea agglomerans]